MARGKAVDPKVRAKAEVMLLTGETAYSIAQRLGIGESLVRSWRDRLRDKDPDAFVSASQKQRDRDEEISDLVHQYLATNLKALHSQLEVAGDVDYLRQFPPSQLALLHSVIADRAARILEVLMTRRSDEDED